MIIRGYQFHWEYISLRIDVSSLFSLCQPAWLSQIGCETYWSRQVHRLTLGPWLYWSSKSRSKYRNTSSEIEKYFLETVSNFGAVWQGLATDPLSKFLRRLSLSETCWMDWPIELHFLRASTPHNKYQILTKYGDKYLPWSMFWQLFSTFLYYGSCNKKKESMLSLIQ